MPNMNPQRRRFLQQLIVGAASLAAIPRVNAALLNGRIFNPCETSLPQHLTNHPIVTAAWAGIDPARYWDCHAHIAGTGDSSGGIYTSPDMKSLWHPVQFAQHGFYMNAACASSDDVDRSYVTRMLHLIDELRPGAKLMLFAFEQAHDEAGKAMPERTAFHVPNAYALDLVRNHPKYFEWVCSIHPYRPDAIDALQAAVADGARAVKWLPSAMGIDPASPRCDAFYRMLAQLDMPLICHAGEEKAVHGAGFKDAGNPLKLRRALDAGVRVVIAHCASIGEDIDMDKGAHGPRVPSFELFTRMMAESRHRQHLFADISAITQRNRSIAVLRAIIEHDEWHERLLNGSDYPLPGVLPLFSPRGLSRAGLLDAATAPVLDEIQKHNPLLFDFVLKRHLRAGTRQLPAGIFHTRDFFLRRPT
ncbi:MAG: amidohydrolase [Gallionellales bacterium GWA2_59_43]|nr:MAG: amidohydrolase [Gallionellales bacterium GWA2_59_43]